MPYDVVDRDEAAALAAPARPTLTIEAAANGAELSFSTEPARVYHLQASPELVTWSDILVTNAVSSTVRFVDTNAESARFYRVQVGP